MSYGKERLQQKVLTNIPILQSLGLKIEELKSDSVILSVPLEANHNHKGTAFGGSLYTCCVSACYALIYAYQLNSGLTDRDLVITEGRISYKKPVDQDFFVECVLASSDWEQVVSSLNSKKPYRLPMKALVYVKKTTIACEFHGEFVFLPQK